MNFPVNDRKTTDAVARLLEKSGGQADYLRVIKLAYLADRDSIIRRGVPIFGGHYYSMRLGPTVGEVMNFVSQRNAPGWTEHIAPRKGHKLTLTSPPAYESLSQAELDILDGVVEEHASRSTNDLVKWSHKYCAEYEYVFWGRKDIKVESILRAGGKTADTIHRVVKEAEEFAELDAALA
jgi:uncharacterized phage-associated protein